MTILQYEDEAVLSPPNGLTLKCSWCGEIIRTDGSERAVAMCQSCFQRVLDEFQRAQQAKNPSQTSQ